MSNLTPRQEAERLEKEKALMERQERLTGLKKAINPLKTKLGAAVQNQRRAHITTLELNKYSDDSDKTMYQAIGRMFVKRTVKQLKDTNKTDAYTAEIEKYKSDLNKLGELIQSEDAVFRNEVAEYQAWMNVQLAGNANTHGKK